MVPIYQRHLTKVTWNLPNETCPQITRVSRKQASLQHRRLKLDIAIRQSHVAGGRRKTPRMQWRGVVAEVHKETES